MGAVGGDFVAALFTPEHASSRKAERLSRSVMAFGAIGGTVLGAVIGAGADPGGGRRRQRGGGYASSLPAGVGATSKATGKWTRGAQGPMGWVGNAYPAQINRQQASTFG